MALGGTVEFFRDSVFNDPTFADEIKKRLVMQRRTRQEKNKER